MYLPHIMSVRIRWRTCLMGMALPLPILSVLLSMLFVWSLAFRDCKETRQDVSAKNKLGTYKEVGRLCVCVCCVLTLVCVRVGEMCVSVLWGTTKNCNKKAEINAQAKRCKHTAAHWTCSIYRYIFTQTRTDTQNDNGTYQVRPITKHRKSELNPL